MSRQRLRNRVIALDANCPIIIPLQQIGFVPGDQRHETMRFQQPCCIAGGPGRQDKLRIEFRFRAGVGAVLKAEMPAAQRIAGYQYSPRHISEVMPVIKDNFVGQKNTNTAAVSELQNEVPVHAR